MSRESQGMANLLDEIKEGGFDDHLNELGNAVGARMDVLAESETAELASTLEVGDLVKIKMNAPLGPKYLLGTLMEVKKINRTTASCNVANPELLPSQRFATGVRVPLKHLEIA